MVASAGHFRAGPGCHRLGESRAVRADTETIIARKDKEIVDLKKELADSQARERQTYNELMACRYPEMDGK